MPTPEHGMTHVPIQAVALSALRLDGGTQPRVAINELAVREYAEAMLAGESMPAVVTFFDGVDYWLADGFHRVHAAGSVASDTIEAQVRVGTRRDAVLFSSGANQAHGLRRTNEDKRKAVTTLIDDDEWRQWSDREIGRQCGVDHVFVGNVRRSLVTVTSEKTATRSYTTKHGTESTMKVERIGRRTVQPTTREAETVLTSRRAMAIEGASLSSLKNLPRKDAAEMVTNAVHSLQGIVSALNQIDAATLASNPNAEPWHEAIAESISQLRAFNRQLSERTA